MSAIGSIGSSSSSSLLYQLYLQSLESTGQAPNIAGASALLGTPGTSNATADSISASGNGSSASDNATSANSSTPGLADLRSQIETAVTNALNNVSAGSTPGDLVQSVHDAIASTLQANGINPQQLRGHGHHGHHHHAAADESQNTLASPSSTTGTTSDGTTTDADGDGDGSSPTDSQSQNLLAILSQLGNQNTQSNGIYSLLGTNNSSSPPTSLASVLASGSTAANGGVDVATLFGQLFANFPAGSGLNVQA